MSSSRNAIDSQFDRAVEIIQSLPKTGPIQTAYDEKLSMYSLYKQATVGNVKSPRPGMWDMLGRAKWDAWAKHKDLDAYEAKWLYVDALLKVLRKYSDQPLARELAQEIESYGGDPSNLVRSGQLSRSGDSASSGSTASEHAPRYITSPPIQNRYESGPILQQPQDDVSSDDEYDTRPRLPAPLRPESASASSMNRYKTPGSAPFSPPPLPSSQPMSGYETPSAYAEAPAAPSAYTRYTSPPYSNQAVQRPFISRPASRESLERAVENLQAHLAALHERLDVLEGQGPRVPRPNPAVRRVNDDWDLDLNDLGLWSMVFSPVTNVGIAVRQLARFMFAASAKRSPVLVVVRRLSLDLSFIFCVIVILRALWRKTGVRRREVNRALKLLGRALFGKTQGILIEDGDFTR